MASTGRSNERRSDGIDPVVPALSSFVPPADPTIERSIEYDGYPLFRYSHHEAATRNARRAAFPLAPAPEASWMTDPLYRVGA